MLEDGWLIDLDRMDSEEAEADRHDHWSNDRTKELILEYADDRDIGHQVVAFRMDVLGKYYDEETADYLFRILSDSIAMQWTEDFIEAHNLEHDFNEWWKDRYRS